MIRTDSNLLLFSLSCKNICLGGKLHWAFGCIAVALSQVLCFLYQTAGGFFWNLSFCFSFCFWCTWVYVLSGGVLDFLQYGIHTLSYLSSSCLVVDLVSALLSGIVIVHFVSFFKEHLMPYNFQNPCIYVLSVENASVLDYLCCLDH